MCWHKWSKWSPPIVVRVTMPVGEFGDTAQATQTIQTRDCAKCYRQQARVVHDGGAVREP